MLATEAMRSIGRRGRGRGSFWWVIDSTGNTRLENVFNQIIKNNDLHAKLLMWQIHQHDYYYIDLHVNL